MALFALHVRTLASGRGLHVCGRQMLPSLSATNSTKINFSFRLKNASTPVALKKQKNNHDEADELIVPEVCTCVCECVFWHAFIS